MHKAILNDVIREFSDANGLSLRETEILSQMVQGYTSSEALGARLDISPNTINNHVKSILDKTGASSKTALLSIFLKGLLKQYLNYRLFAKSPRMLILIDDQDEGRRIAGAMEEYGVSSTSADPANVSPQRMAELSPDFVLVADSDMEAGLERIKQLRKASPISMTVFLACRDPIDRKVCMNAGITSGFSLPVDAGRLFFLILENYVDSDYDYSRLVRTRVDIPVKLERGTDLKIGNLGFGGVFLPVDRAQWGGLDIQVGDTIGLSFCLQEGLDTIKASGEIVWKCTEPRIDKPSGMGLRFTSISERDLESVHEFVRTLQIRALLPKVARRVRSSRA